MENRVREFRKRVGLTQAKLAELIGTSQQQIQRVEKAAVPVRLEMARALSVHLGVPPASLFPGLRKAAAAKSRGQLDDDEARNAAYLESGIDADPRTWTFKVLLRGHAKAQVFRVSSEDRSLIEKRIDLEVTARDSEPMLVFYSEVSAVVLNLRHVLYGHLLFDLFVKSPPTELEAVRVRFAGVSEPLDFGVEQDSSSIFDEAEDVGELGGILLDAEAEIEAGHRFEFSDSDGERVYLRAGDVACIEIPLWALGAASVDVEDD